MTKKNIIITGGASGIGKTICEKYAKNNWTVIILDKDKANGENLCEELNKITNAFFYECDFSDINNIKKISNELKVNFYSVSAIIHNVRSRYISNSLIDNINNEFEKDFNIYIRSPLILTTTLLDNLENELDPSVIFIGSTNSSFVSQQPISYHICKGALFQLVRYLAISFGKKQIRVNLINPGVVKIQERMKRNHIFEEAINLVIPLGRAAETEEIATLCYFLTSSETRYITGSAITIDGGEHIIDHMSLAQSILNKFNSNNYG